MDVNMQLLVGICIPFLGTTLGSTMVFFMRDKISSQVEQILLGSASGVMIAASIWSLLIPSIEIKEAENGLIWFPAATGFLIGILFLLMLDKLIPNISLEQCKFKNNSFKIKKNVMMILAIILHNIPEGMAVGVAFAGSIVDESLITSATAFALSIGVAIQNFPEGAIISMPLKTIGMSKSKAFLIGTLSGIVEPIGAFVTIILTSIVVPILPYLLSFAAGAMIYVVVEDLIPEFHNNSVSKLGVVGVGIGFVCMMILDVTLG